MVEGAWQRRLLGLAVAALVPIAIGGAACGQTDSSPEPVAGAAGVVATSGSSAGGSSAGRGGASSTGTAATAGRDSVGGSPTAGNDAGGSAAAGGTSSDEGSCCTEGDTEACTADGKSLKKCMMVMGAGCPQTALYVHVWKVQACPNGCARSDSAGTASTIRCE